MSDGYYSSKKTDDICDDVCGQVIFHIFLFNLISIIKVCLFFFSFFVSTSSLGF